MKNLLRTQKNRSTPALLASTVTLPISCCHESWSKNRPSSSKQFSICSSLWATAEQRVPPRELNYPAMVDGIIDQDALGLSRIHVQAKRYAAGNIIGRPTIQAFAGALAGNQANQGVFITTSRFSSEAAIFAEQIPTRIVLIDGDRLARLMIRYGVGVQVKRTVNIVEIDEDFLEQPRDKLISSE